MKIQISYTDEEGYKLEFVGETTKEDAIDLMTAMLRHLLKTRDD